MVERRSPKPDVIGSSPIGRVLIIVCILFVTGEALRNYPQLFLESYVGRFSVKDIGETFIFIRERLTEQENDAIRRVVSY